MNVTDIKMYDKIKIEIYNKIPKHSAYRSGLLVKKYKEEFIKKYGKLKSPYIGDKNKKRRIIYMV